jgi:hypothetical protein
MRAACQTSVEPRKGTNLDSVIIGKYFSCEKGKSSDGNADVDYSRVVCSWSDGMLYPGQILAVFLDESRTSAWEIKFDDDVGWLRCSKCRGKIDQRPILQSGDQRGPFDEELNPGVLKSGMLLNSALNSRRRYHDNQLRDLFPPYLA